MSNITGAANIVRVHMFVAVPVQTARTCAWEARLGFGKPLSIDNPMRNPMGSPLEGNLVDVISEEVYPARISHEDGKITSVERISGAFEGYLIPGLIDAHIHIESSHLCPSRFAEAVVPHGTTAVVTDPHEIANVLGIPGIEYMVKDSGAGPLRVYFTAPSCVPATPFETAGASIGADDIEHLLRRDEFVALGEMMNYPGAVSDDPEVLEKINVARKLGKPVDGHSPLLSGESLAKYASLGITTDHECTSSSEAEEKYAAGMTVMVRQGSASKNLPALAEFARKHEFMLVSDDKSASDLLQGHVNIMLSECVSLGIDAMRALRAATINPANHYRLPLGAVEPGKYADVVKVKDLVSFEVEDVYVGGELVASNGSPKFEARPKEATNEFVPQRKTPSDFDVLKAQSDVQARVIGVTPGELVTERLTAHLLTENGHVLPDVQGDVLKIAVVNRYADAPVSNGFVKGFGLKRGAIASTVAHDSHNIITVGTNGDDMASAVNALVEEGGGFAVRDGRKTHMLGFHLAGLMSTKKAFEVKRMHDGLKAVAADMGCSLEHPFMTMSFLSLLVIPRLKIGDKGLFDVEEFDFVDVLEE